MDSWPFLRSAVLIITIGFTVSFSTSFAFTQSPNREKPRLKDFGQYSALMATLKEAFDAEDQRPIIIFQTDGDELGLLRNPIFSPAVPPNLPPDLRLTAQKFVESTQRYVSANRREFSLDDVYRAAEKSRATIYTVIPGFRLIGLSPEEQINQMKIASERRAQTWGGKAAIERNADRWARTPPEALRYEVGVELKGQQALAVLATMTGGWTEFLEEPSQADENYSRIFSDINRRYIVGYYPTNKEHDGKRRKVNVEVRGHSEYIVMGRKSYYAPEAEQ